MPAAYILQQHAQTFKEFPPRQAPAGFNAGEMLDKLLKAAARQRLEITGNDRRAPDHRRSTAS